MRTLDRFKLRLQSLFRRNRLDRELDEEVRYHLEELTRQHVQRGMDPERARATALRQFGSVAHTQEDCREQRRTRWAEDFAADLRFGARLLAKSPGFTAVALLSLALGIGANTAIFTMLEAVILSELPVHEPGSLVQIVGVVPGQPGDQSSFSYVNFLWLRERTPMFSSLFTWDTRRIEAGEGENMEWVSVHRVSDEYFSGLGVTPVLGRALADERENPAVAIISFNWWQKRYGGDRAVLGRPMRLGGLPFTIVGVAPAGFYGTVVGAAPDVFIPIVSDPLTNPQSNALSDRNSSWLSLLARLAPGVKHEQASAGLPLVWDAMVQET